MVLLCNMLCEDFSITVFSLKHDIFIIKHTSSEMLSFLHCWDYCWKCEFNTDVKTENYYQHYGEQLGFYKKVHIKTQSRMFLWSLYCKKQRIPIYLTKTVLKRTSNAMFNMKKVDLDDRHWTRRLLLSAYISWKIL